MIGRDALLLVEGVVLGFGAAVRNEGGALGRGAVQGVGAVLVLGAIVRDEDVVMGFGALLRFEVALLFRGVVVYADGVVFDRDVVVGVFDGSCFR